MSFLKKGKKQSLKKMKNVESKTTLINKLLGTKKLISFEELNMISNLNKDKFNRNIWTEKIVEDIPQIKGWNMFIIPIMEHNHHLGEETEPHLRCRIEHGLELVTTDDKMKEKYNGMWIQDISMNQWNSLREFNEKV